MSGEILPSVSAIDARLSALEDRVGTGADSGDLDRQLEHLRGEKQAAVRAQEYERAAELRDQEKQLLSQNATRQQDWKTAHPSLPDLAETCRQLSNEVKELRALLHQHGIDPHEPAA